jgi:quercetin dioxygenase-like cupin family protein
MRIIKADSKEMISRRGDAERFTGEVLIQDLVTGRFEKDINVYRVRFQPGALTHWHRHPGGSGRPRKIWRRISKNRLKTVPGI